MAKDKSNEEQMLIDKEKAIEEKLKAKEEAIVAKQKAKEEAAIAKLQAREEAINAKLKAKEEKLKAKDEAKAAKLKAKEDLLKAKTEQKEKAEKEKEKARLESEKAHVELAKAKEEAKAEKEKMKEELAKAKEDAANDKLKAKEDSAKAKEAAAQEKLKAKEDSAKAKEAAAQEKLKAKEESAKAKEAQAQEKLKAKEAAEKLKAKESESKAKEEKVKQAEKEKPAKEANPKAEKEKAKQAALREKLKEKAEKEKAKEELAKAKAKAKEEAEIEEQKLISEKLAKKAKAKEDAEAKVRQEAKEAKKEQKAREKAKANQERTREINLEKERLEREKAAQKRQQDKEKAAALIAKKKLQEQKAKEKEAANAEKEKFKSHKKEIKYAEMKGLRFNAKTPAKKAADATQIIELIKERNAQKPKVNAGKYSIVNSSEEEFLAVSEGTNILSKIRNVNVASGISTKESEILNDISLNIINGETIGVIGDAQSGKTTFAKVLEGEISRSNGSVLIKDSYTSMKPSQITPKEKKVLEENIQVIYDQPVMSTKPNKRISEYLTEKNVNANDLKRIYIKAFDIITATTLSKLLEGKEQPKVVERITLKWLLEQIAEERFESIDRKLYYDAIESLYKHEKPFALTAADYLSMRRSVRKDIKESTEPKHKLLEKMAMETLQILGLSETYLNRCSVELSSLEQEQIALAYYLLLRPAILVTDNSLSSIKDENDRKAFVKIVQEIKRRYGLTLVLIENDINIQKTLSNRMVVMHKGKIVEVAETSELIKNPIHPITKMIIKPKTEAKARKLLANTNDGDGLWYKVFKTTEEVDDHFVYGDLDSITKWAGGK